MTITAPDGAYIIGGGRYHFGQAMTEDLARAAFEFPTPTLGNMIELLRSVLEQLPLDALKPFQAFLGIPDNLFGNIVDAVNSIISSLQNRPVFMLLADFTTWVADFIKAITGTVTSGNLADLAAWFQQNVVDKIANLGTEIQNILTRIVEFVTHGELFTAIAEVVEKIVQAITGSLGGFDDLKNWITNTLSPVIDGFTAFIAGIISIFGGDGAVASVTEALATLKRWLDNIFTPVVDGLAGIVKLVSDFIAAITGAFGGAGGTIADAVAAIQHWIDNIFKPVADGLAEVVAWLNTFFQSIASLFGGSGTTVTDALDSMSKWLTNFQSLLDALFGAFGGVAGTGKTITEVIGAITGWFSGVFQKLIDGINALASLIPGLTTGTNPIQNAIDIIAGILGVGQSAASSAAQANLGVAAIVAAQNGGGDDDFDYSVSASLPSPWVSTYSGDATSTLGPDGRGYLVWKYSGFPNTWREVHYRKSDVTMPNSNCIITAVLSRAPGYGTTDHSKLWIEALWSATDQSRLRVQIGPNYAQLQSVSATGTITNVGAKHTIPTVHNGDSFALKIRGNTVSLMTGTVTHFSETVAVGGFSGRQFGFGSMYAGGLLGAAPAAEFNGITWQN